MTALGLLGPLLPELLQLADARQYRAARDDEALLGRRVPLKEERVGHRVDRGGVRPMLGLVARMTLLRPIPLRL